MKSTIWANWMSVDAVQNETLRKIAEDAHNPEIKFRKDIIKLEINKA